MLAALRKLLYVDRRSTRGGGYHVYVPVADIPTENHTIHAVLARAILAKISADTGELLGGRGRLRGDPVLLVNPHVGREAILRVAPAEHSNPNRGRSARLAGRRAATPDLQETGYRRRGNTGRFGPMGRTLLRLSNCQEGRRARPNPGRVGRGAAGC